MSDTLPVLKKTGAVGKIFIAQFTSPYSFTWILRTNFFMMTNCGGRDSETKNFGTKGTFSSPKRLS